MKPRPTIKDVAPCAGVSRQTVSRVINHKGEVSAATRARVLTAIEELGYRPNSIARSLVSKWTHTVGLLLSDVSNPFYPEVIYIQLMTLPEIGGRIHVGLDKTNTYDFFYRQHF